MQASRGAILAAGTAAMLALAACGDGGKEPRLMNIRAGSTPDEFSILPPKALSMPPSLAELPEPAPAGANLTDPTPKADAVAALGGKLVTDDKIAAADAGLVNYAARGGLESDIRAVLAADDLAWRRAHKGKLLERWFGVNVYFESYKGMSLDQDAEIWRWRKLGVLTPSAPPPPAKK